MKRLCGGCVTRAVAAAMRAAASVSRKRSSPPTPLRCARRPRSSPCIRPCGCAWWRALTAARCSCCRRPPLPPPRRRRLVRATSATIVSAAPTPPRAATTTKPARMVSTQRRGRAIGGTRDGRCRCRAFLRRVTRTRARAHSPACAATSTERAGGAPTRRISIVSAACFSSVLSYLSRTPLMPSTAPPLLVTFDRTSRCCSGCSGKTRKSFRALRHRLNRPWANPTTASPPPLPSPSLRSPRRRRRRLLLARHRPGAPPAAHPGP